MANPTVSEYPKKIQIGIHDGFCNLKCSMCFLHSKENNQKTKISKGTMAYDAFCGLLDQVKEHNSIISPYRWSEPLVFNSFLQYAKAVKDRDLSTVINTNGLSLNRKMRCDLIEMAFDSVTISLDAISNTTYQKIRGVDRLNAVKDVVFDFLEERGEKTYPRIGVSLALSEINSDEEDAFISFWTQYVDVVRVNKMLNSDFSIDGIDLEGDRVPCGLLYDSMVIDYKGDVVLCCMDALNSTNMGNVFKDGIHKVWNNPKFSRIRAFHEEGRYNELPLCRNCSNWANINYKEKIVGNILLRESKVMKFYNRIDRLTSWNYSLPVPE